MLVGCDIDGTISADPTHIGPLLAALRAAGHRVAVLTGVSGTETLTPQDVSRKATYLQQLGLSNCWDVLVVFPHPHAIGKAKWIAEHHVDLFFDNNIDNAEQASKFCTVFVPWATRTGGGM